MIALSIILGIGILVFMSISIVAVVYALSSFNNHTQHIIIAVFGLSCFITMLGAIAIFFTAPELDRLRKGEKVKYELIEGHIYRKIQ